MITKYNAQGYATQLTVLYNIFQGTYFGINFTGLWIFTAFTSEIVILNFVGICRNSRFLEFGT